MSCGGGTAGWGDRLSRALGMVGVTEEWVTRRLGRPCGCAERRETLNRLGAWVDRVLAGKLERAGEYLAGVLDDGNSNGGTTMYVAYAKDALTTVGDWGLLIRKNDRQPLAAAPGDRVGEVTGGWDGQRPDPQGNVRVETRDGGRTVAAHLVRIEEE